jgi:uncharacterized oligopeptide transporter (OPT) family protein
MAQLPALHSGLSRWLPPIGSRRYHLLLSATAILILGPLGAISAAYMNFSIGFFVGGQVLAGILGSAVTLPYGPDGKHGANYMQTMAASVAGLCGMVVLIQAMQWMGLPEPATWKLFLYILSIGMFGVGVGMLYTPVLVDQMQLAFPSGLAVANILRALTDPKLLRQSIAKLGGGALAGFAGGLAGNYVPAVEAIGLSASTFGAGMIVRAGLAIPALIVALLGEYFKPTLVEMGWLAPGAPFRKIGFIIALGTILGAALVDISIILLQAFKTLRTSAKTSAGDVAEDWKRVDTRRLILWVVGWGVAVVVIGSQVLQQPVWFLAIAVVLVFLFVLVNGISMGISDSNPISSAFVLTVFILAALGLRDPGVGLMAAAIVLISCSSGGDMQQDRSTGWRLGTSRIIQFRYQIIGIVMGAALCVVLAKVFLGAYPALRIDQFAQPGAAGTERWNSAMTFKFVGALRGITTGAPHVMTALQIGVAFGLATEVSRKLLARLASYRRFTSGSALGRTAGFVVDSVLLPSPYASSFGGFVPLQTTYWWVAGGIAGSIVEIWGQRNKPKDTAGGDVPADMSTTSLVGGGLIAGESISALTIGVLSLLQAAGH